MAMYVVHHKGEFYGPWVDEATATKWAEKCPPVCKNDTPTYVEPLNAPFYIPEAKLNRVRRSRITR